jgi:hypothetical protein
MIIGIEKNKDAVKLTVGFDNKIYNIYLNKRYVIWQKERWDFLKDILNRFFIKTGKKGCYILADVLYKNKINLRDKRSLSDIDIWDLSLIFDDVEFIDNTDDIQSDIQRLLTTNKIEWLADQKYVEQQY